MSLNLDVLFLLFSLLNNNTEMDVDQDMIDINSALEILTRESSEVNGDASRNEITLHADEANRENCETQLASLPHKVYMCF